MTTNDSAVAAANPGRNWFLAAGVAGLGTTAFHIFAGNPEVMHPLYASSLPLASVAVLDVVWQQITALMFSGAVVAVLAAYRPGWRQPVAILLGGHYLVVAVIFLVWGVVWFGSPWPMPQWALFFVMAGLMFAGLRSTPRSAT